MYIAMKHRNAAVFGGGGDQSIGQRYAVISVAASATARSLRRIRNPSSSVLSATYSEVLRAEYRISIRIIGVVHSRSSLIAALRSAASSAGRDENRHHAEMSAMNGASLAATRQRPPQVRLRLVGRQLLDVLERVSIQPAWAEHALDEPPPPLSTLLIAQRRLLGGRGGDHNRMLHDPRVAPEHDQNYPRADWRNAIR